MEINNVAFSSAEESSVCDMCAQALIESFVSFRFGALCLNQREWMIISKTEYIALDDIGRSNSVLAYHLLIRETGMKNGLRVVGKQGQTR